MDKITLYTIHCPACVILENKLKEKNIQYNTITDRNVMKNLNFINLPVLEVNGQFLNYYQAWKWVEQR